MTQTALHRRGLLAATLLAAAGLPFRARGAEAPAVVAPIQQLYDGLMVVMHMGPGSPFQQRFERLAPVVETTFDLDNVLQVSVGPLWGSLPPDQQELLRAAFRRYTVASYVNSFDSFDGQRFEVSPQLRSLPNGEEVVHSRIVAARGDSHTLDYVMRQEPQRWRAVDVLLDGTISRVAVQRSDFRSLLRNGGAVALAKSLQTKTADLSGG